MAERRISQAELARRVGLQQSSINLLYNGKSQGSTKLNRIARELRTTPEFLEGLTDDPSEDFVGDYLTEDERDWVEILRRIGQKERAPLLAMARSLAGKD